MKALFFILIFTVVSCTKRQATPILPDRFTVHIELNICEPPFNAIPNDTISDVKAIQMALDALRNIRNNSSGNIFYKLKTSLVIPNGTYRIDENMDFGNDTLVFKKETGTLSIRNSSNITIKGGTFIMQ